MSEELTKKIRAIIDEISEELASKIVDGLIRIGTTKRDGHKT